MNDTAASPMISFRTQLSCWARHNYAAALAVFAVGGGMLIAAHGSWYYLVALCR